MGRRALRKSWFAVVGGGVLALGSLGLTPSEAADETTMYVVQGLPSRTVSVEVDGDPVAESLAGGKVVGPISVRSGVRTVQVSDGDKTLVTSKVDLPAGSSSEVVVHLPASPTGDPLVTRFDNKLEAVAGGRAAHAVAHVAAAGPVDIRVDEKVFLANVATGEYLYKVLPAMTYNVDVVPTGTSDPVLGPLDLELMPEMLTWVFAVGAPGEDLTVIKHVIPLAGTEGSKRPADVNTGTGGQAAALAAAGP